MKTFKELLGITEAKATMCGRCGTVHVPPAQGGKCPALAKEELETVEESADGKKLVKGGSGTESDPHTAHTWVDIRDFGDHMHHLAKKSGKPVHYKFNNDHYKATPESKGFKIKSGTGEIIKEQQGVSEVWKGHSDTVKNPNFNDELSYRRVNPVGNRLKSGKLSADERGSQERLKSLMKYTQKKGGLAGPKGVLPEQGVVESRPGWMLKQDPKLAAKVKAKTDLAKKRQAAYGNPSAGKSIEKGMAEGQDWSPGAKETMNKDKIASLKNLIASYKQKGNDAKVKELQAELKSMQESVDEAKYYGHDDFGYSLRPGHDEGQPHYNPNYDNRRRGNDTHHVTIGGKPWKEFDSYRHASSVVKSLRAKGKDAEAHIGHMPFKEETQQSNNTELVKEEVTTMNPMDRYIAAISNSSDFTSLDEKKLTPAEMKKREEVAKAIERENPDMPMAKKMAIATATAKKVAEDVEEVEEAKSYTVPKTEREKDLAAAAEPRDKITHKDVLVKRGVVKEEELEEVEEAFQRNMNPHNDLAGRGSRTSFNKTAAGKKREFDRGTELLKDKMKFTKSQGGIAGPKGKLPEEVELTQEEGNPTGVTIHWKNAKTGKSSWATHFTAKSAAAHEKELKAAGHTITQRKLEYAKEEVEQIDELDKETLKSYVSKATDSARTMPGYGTKDEKSKKTLRHAGIAKATEKLAKEEVQEEQVNEGMISYVDFTDKIYAHRRAGNAVIDHKYTDKKASYTVVDKEGTGRKVTHTPSGSKIENLGAVAGYDQDSEKAEVPTEKRGRGRPKGSTSGARRHK